MRAALILAVLMAPAAANAAALIEVKPGPEAQARLQEALIAIEPGGTVALAEGIYDLSDGLSLDVAGVTVRGAGPDKTILSFKGQTAGAEGLLVTSDKVTLRDFAIEDTKGDAFKAKGADIISFINLRATWTGGPKPTNGAYGFYPVESTDVLIDGVEANGASDAGIYVGQSERIIVRNSLAHFNVAGIEIENSYFADVHDNTATHNTGGILVFDLPDLPKQGGHHVRVYANRIIENDTANFAPEGNIVGNVPRGTGLMIMANRDVEAFDNVIDKNGTVNVLIAAYTEEVKDESYYKYPEAITIRNNRIGSGGEAPDNDIGKLIAGISGTPIPDIVYDGVRPTKDLIFGTAMDDRISVRENGDATFINLRAPLYYLAKWLHVPSRSLKPYDIPREPLAPVVLPQDQRKGAASL